MAHVTVMIGGRSFRLACNEGEQPHLEGLARQIDGKIAQIRREVGEIGDQRLVVMAALTIADELSEARRTIGELERQAGERHDNHDAARREADEWAAAVAEGIEDPATALAGSSKS
jgi:cell division protein ZapA